MRKLKQPLHTELSLWLHKIAGHVGKQEFEKVPVGLVLVLERADGTHEVLWNGGEDMLTRTRLKECGYAVARAAVGAKNAKPRKVPPILKLWK